ncbi:MAG: AAA family ATPase [Methylocapsa sp.]|nr:AAA family ATPase [Methylocapsa sp.]
MRPSQSEFDFQPENQAGQSPAAGIANILGILRREWRLPVFGSLLGLILGFAYLALVPSLYKSTAYILVDRGTDRYLQANKIGDNLMADDGELATQIAVISSESVIIPVIRQLDLAHDKEFAGTVAGQGGALRFVKNAIKRLLGLKDHIPANPDLFLERSAVESFLKHLTVSRDAYVLEVTFSSEDPDKAAQIANAVADTYIASSLEAKSQSTKITNHWLQDRLTELKEESTRADRELQKYKAANNLVTTSHGSLNDEQIATLSTQLVNARAATAEAKARLDRIQQIGNGDIPSATVTDELNNGVITNIRTHYLDLAEREAELSARVGPGHAAVAHIHEKMEELRRSIRNEEQRIAQAYASDYQIAKAREKDLTAAMAQLVGKSQTNDQAQVPMRELESSADTYRNLYNSFLQKAQETAIQTQTIPVYDIRIISRAFPPLHKNFKPAIKALAGGIAFGLFLGAGAGIGRELLADVFRTPAAVETATGIQCLGTLPVIGGDRQQRTRLLLSSAQNGVKALPARPGVPGCVEEFVLDAPFSRFTETLRSVKVLLNAAQTVHGIKVVGIVSSVAQEGKTTIAANLAALMIASSEARALLIDGDLHQRSLTARLAPRAREGLIEALADPARLEAFVYKRERSRLDVLPCVLEGRVPNAAELLGSPQMEKLLTHARRTYDYIMIELAPVISVVDVKVAERFIDSFLFVVEWGHSKKTLVKEALSEVEIIRDRLAGIILNKADPAALRSLEAYKGKRYHDYYIESGTI